jgi:hypothetical protein
MSQSYWRRPATFLVLLLFCVDDVPAEPTAEKYVEVTAEEAEVYRNNEVVLRARKNQRFRLVAQNGNWIGVTWNADSGLQTGWISVSKVAAVDSGTAVVREDVSTWVSPKGTHANKKKLKELLEAACQDFAQTASAKLTEAIQLDPGNALLHYVLANAWAENASWSAVGKAMKTGHSLPDAYLYVTEAGLARFLDTPCHIEPIRKLAVSLTKRAQKRDTETAYEVLRDLRQMGYKIAQTRPRATVNLHLGMALITVAHSGLESVSVKLDAAQKKWVQDAKARDTRWINAVQKELSARDSEEILIVKSYLDLNALDGKSISQFMGYAPAMAMAIASGVRLQAKRKPAQPKPVASEKQEPRHKGRFYRHVSSYDFLSDIIAETAPSAGSGDTGQDEKPEDTQAQMAEFFAKQEKEFLNGLKPTIDKRRVLTAKQFLVAALSGEEADLFQRLMQPKTEREKQDRDVWDTACDEGLSQMGKVLDALVAQVPE